MKHLTIDLWFASPEGNASASSPWLEVRASLFSLSTDDNIANLPRHIYVLPHVSHAVPRMQSNSRTLRDTTGQRN